ncbi:MAG: NADH-quinone oxidoreductase subunit H [Lentisphaeria bacterium]|nr:NADH-quinone oxidoreductase subunit H [Lentisphaeria bacterium]
MINTLCNIFFNILLMVFAPLLMVGVIKKVKAFFARRKGPSVLQVIYDIRRLFLKGEIISSFVRMNYTSAFALGSLIAAGLFVPQITGEAVLNNFSMDFLIFVYLFGLSRFFSAVNALQMASSFEGMGSSRELVFSITGELTLMMCLVSLAFFGSSCDFAGIFGAFRVPSIDNLSVGVLACVILFVIMLLEGCRVPIDDPTTHLELTMIHEVMILDNSGVSLAYFMYSGMLKIYLFSSIIGSIILSEFAHLSCFIYGGLFLLLLFLISVIIGIIESVQARLRMVHVQQYILFAAGLAVILLISVIFVRI